MKERIRVSAPGKLMLFGEHAVVYGYPCIVTAVDQRMRVLVEASAGEKLKIKAPGVGLSDYSLEVSKLDRRQDLPKGARFVVMAVYNFFNKFNVKSGLKIRTESEFSSEFGFGSSSAVTVAVTKALAELFNLKVDNKQLFELSYRTVLDVQGVGSGFDLAAAIWGGTLWFIGGGKTIVPLQKKELPIVIGYTGIKADTPTLVKQVAEKNGKYPEMIGRIFETIAYIVKEAKTALERKDWLKLGDLMNFNQGLLDTLGVNTGKLSTLTYAAREAGALGAKLSGAGGGDCMLALVLEENKKRAERAIKETGGQVLRVKNSAEGVRLE